MIRLLFRHPMQVQKSAPEYLALVRDAGFRVEPAQVSYPYLWWSREDLGIGERWFGIAPPPAPQREETLINLVAVKPDRPSSVDVRAAVDVDLAAADVARQV